MKRIFCDANCKDGYRTDRRYGLIYGSWNMGEGRIVDWFLGCVEQGICPYCTAEVVKYRRKNK